MLDLVRNAGSFGYLILFMAPLGALLALATVALAVPARTLRASLVLAGLVVGLGASTLLLGAVGRIAGRMATFRAAANVPSDMREQLLALGFEESAANTTLGAMVGGPLVLLGAAVIGAAFARRGGTS